MNSLEMKGKCIHAYPSKQAIGVPVQIIQEIWNLENVKGVGQNKCEHHNMYCVFLQAVVSFFGSRQ